MSAGKMEGGGAGIWIGTALVRFNFKIGVYRSFFVLRELKAIYPLNGMIDESLLPCVCAPIATILAI
jgi:hypothetical protein